MTAEDAEKRKTHTGVTAWVFQEENEELFRRYERLMPCSLNQGTGSTAALPSG